MPGPVDRSLVGYVDTEAQPSSERKDLGSVRLLGPPVLTVREHASLRLVYRVGRFGLDDRGSFRIVMRFAGDGGPWQSEDPAAPNYVTVRSSSGACEFRSRFEPYGGPRPWFRMWSCQLLGGYLSEGDALEIGLGLRVQTFAEEAWELRFLVDVCGTGHFVEVDGPEQGEEVLWRPIVPGPPHRWLLVAPTRARPGQPFWLGLKAEDAYGNPTPSVQKILRLSSSAELEGLPEQVELTPSSPTPRLQGLRAHEQGTVRITATDAQTGEVLAVSNPIVVAREGSLSFWADLHGQSGETVGVGRAEDYFVFARDKAFLDAAGHQANDFQISEAFWRRLDEVVRSTDSPGRFVLLPGYEWSGNTAVGGDRNVYFRHDGRPIRRSSHALLTDRSDEALDCTDARALFAALRQEDAVAVAHVGGRWADLHYAHDELVERAVEIHSDWGTFEWLVHDAFAIGARVGIVANSDGHKGRPGASWPGAATFGAYGGLTCLYAEELTREALFDALRARRTVATTGARLDLDVWAEVDGVRVRPGEVRATRARSARLHVQIAAASPVHGISARVGQEELLVHHPSPEPGQRLAIRLTGARYRGRGREVDWTCQVRLQGAAIQGLVPVALWNPDRPLVKVSDQEVKLSAITTGNTVGFDARLSPFEPGARVQIETNRGSLEAPLAELGVSAVRRSFGGLGMAVTVCRLSDHNPHLDCSFSCDLPVREEGDSPLWVAVTLEDGHMAWSSPIYLYRERP